jgi:DNA polymerase elongation subunit (family B)
MEEQTISCGELRTLHNIDDYEVFDEKTKKWVNAKTSEYMYNGPVGFSSVDDPYAPINAITIYKKWLDAYTTIAVPPEEWDGVLDATLPSDVIIVKNEQELLELTLYHLTDADIISGWNSDFFDLPYMIKRTARTLGERRINDWCFEGMPEPKFGEVEKFGSKQTNATIFGRIHLDYLQLFRKFTLGGRSSYALAAIADEELDIDKLTYSGSLADLYHDDFNFFLRYNIRDVEVMVGLDKKFKYIDIANEMIHENTVRFSAIFGSVNLIDTGIINYCHNEKHVIVRDREFKKGDPIEGALVVEPKIGIHEWIGSVDINSLYPSSIRAINISPEKIIGQFTCDEEDWAGIRAKDEKYHALKLENDNDLVEKTGAEWYEILKSKSWAISGYGTVLDQSSGPGIVAAILGKWYAERKSLQKLKKEWGNKATSAKKEFGIDSVEYKEAKTQEEFYDLKQGIKKVLLNSTYGALINEYDRFYDPRLGASTTGTGRQITTHMIQTTSMLITGKPQLLRKEFVRNNDGFAHKYYIDDDSIITGDTDSCYFKTGASNKEEAIAIADAIGDGINESFPGFMEEAFCCTSGFKDLIAAGREIVADRSMFFAKKKYVARVVNLDGKDLDPNDKKALKIMGLEIKKSDTPKIIQKFLKEVVNMILDGKTYKELETYINEYRKNMFVAESNIVDLGISKSVNKLDQYTLEYTRLEKTGKGKARLPGHVRASINFNETLKEVGDNTINPIMSGSKIRVFYLAQNDHKFTSISIPSDLETLPSWFTERFTIDVKLTSSKLVDDKISILFAPLNWEVPTVQSALVNSLLEF